MLRINNCSQLAQWRDKVASQGSSVAFVPTMGNLHEGHLSLVRQVRQLCDVTVVSIFVNPMQFGINEDLADYPRTLAKDEQQLQREGVNCLFLPQQEELYPHGIANHTKVLVPELNDILCGAFRPGHFCGVTTVVMMLFQLVRPQVAIFGEKDYQQLVIIKRMVADLQLPIKILAGATYRTEDGLALSSRNQYLTSQQRQLAPLIYRTLSAARDQISEGERSVQTICQLATANLQASGFEVEYFSICHTSSLKIVADSEPLQPQDYSYVLLCAVKIGTTRLIDCVFYTH